MKNKQEDLGKVESITTIIVNIGTIISWAFSIFTFFVLASQPQPISLGGILELNVAYKILFLTSIFLGYMQVLRRIWEHGKRTQSDSEPSFGSYIYSSLVNFKRPLVLVGFLIVLGTTIILIFEADMFCGAMLCVFGFFGGAFLLTDGKFLLERARKRFDDDFRKRWLKRVKKQLYQNGYVHTGNFLDLPEDSDEANWAIKEYFDIYEFEQDLIFSQQYLEKNEKTYEIREIRFKHVPSHLPK